MTAVKRTLLSVFAILCGFAASLACPFCLAPPQTFSEQFELSDFVVVGELLKFEVLGNGTQPVSTFRIREFLSAEAAVRSESGLRVGSIIERAAEASGKPGDLYLLYGDLSGGGGDSEGGAVSGETFAGEGSPGGIPVRGAGLSAAFPVVEWTDHAAISAAAAEYLRTLPRRGLPVPERLSWYIQHLESADPLIAGDAWAEFGCAAYEDVRACRKLYSPDRLRSWIGDPGMSPERLGLYGLMLGLSGSAADAVFLRGQFIREETGEFRFGAEGLVAGYLLLSGESGLAEVEQQFLKPSTAASARHALLQTLDFFHTYEPTLIAPARICQSARLLLRDPVLSETTVMSLARWRDWESLGVLIEVFDEALLREGSVGEDSLLRGIVQFAQLCSRAGKPVEAAKAAEVSERTLGLSRAADEFLERVSRTHPELLKARESLFQAPAP
jgi:hypothetical protein